MSCTTVPDLISRINSSTLQKLWDWFYSQLQESDSFEIEGMRFQRESDQSASIKYRWTILKPTIVDGPYHRLHPYAGSATGCSSLADNRGHYYQPRFDITVDQSNSRITEIEIGSSNNTGSDYYPQIKMSSDEIHQ